MDNIRRMPLGQVVDYVIAFNERQESAEKAAEKTSGEAPKKRKATQADINAFFG